MDTKRRFFKREVKLLAWCSLVLGGNSLVVGALTLAGQVGPRAGQRCHVFCGLRLLVAEMFGSLAGNVVEGLLWLEVGTAACWLGFRALRG